MIMFIFVLIAHELGKFIHRKLHFADFQRNYEREYTLNVDILKLSLIVYHNII